jgi:hypothetical protein
MEHLTNKLDARGLVWVCLFEVHNEAEGPVFEGRVCGADDDCVPMRVLVSERHRLTAIFEACEVEE